MHHMSSISESVYTAYEDLKVAQPLNWYKDQPVPTGQEVALHISVLANLLEKIHLQNFTDWFLTFITILTTLISYGGHSSL